MNNVKIENLDGAIKVIANDNYKITNSKGEFYSDFIYLPSFYNLDDNPQGIRAVGYGIWGQFIEDEIPNNKAEHLERDIKSLLEKQLELSEILLDTDFRLMCLEMGITP